MTQNITKEDIKYVPYTSELQLPGIMSLIENDLSEPYSIYTYRYFINNWPNLCFMVGKVLDIQANVFILNQICRLIYK